MCLLQKMKEFEHIFATDPTQIHHFSTDIIQPAEVHTVPHPIWNEKMIILRGEKAEAMNGLVGQRIDLQWAELANSS